MTDRARTCGECPHAITRGMGDKYFICALTDTIFDEPKNDIPECRPRRAFRVLRDEVRRLRNERSDMAGRRDRSDKKRA